MAIYFYPPESNDLTPHPFAACWSAMEPKAFEAFCADVAVRGVRTAIVVTRDGQILDGVTRWRASRQVGRECPAQEFDGDDADAMAFVLSANLHRRHLQTKKALAETVAAMYFAENPDESTHPTNESVAVALGMTTRTYQSAKAVVRERLGLDPPPGGRPATVTDRDGGVTPRDPRVTGGDSHDPMVLELDDDGPNGWADYAISFVLSKARDAGLSSVEAGAIPCRVKNADMRGMTARALRGAA